MDVEDRIQEIKKKLETNEYFIHPLSDANIREDVAYLMSLIDQKNQKIAHLEKKNDVISQQLLELTQEIENVKSDFGDGTR